MKSREVTLRWAQELVSAATVTLPRSQGQGVLVHGGFVLTAAHCIKWSTGGGMTLGDHCLELVNKQELVFPLAVVAVEPLADIAVLASPDNQVFYDDAMSFGHFCDATPPVNVSTSNFRLGERVRVHVLTHKGAWLTGKAVRYGIPGDQPWGRVCIEPDEPIESGTSGGPVIDDTGNLVGLVSWTSEGDDSGGMMPRPHLALPRWTWMRIEAGQKAIAPPAAPSRNRAKLRRATRSP